VWLLLLLMALLEKLLGEVGDMEDLTRARFNELVAAG